MSGRNGGGGRTGGGGGRTSGGGGGDSDGSGGWRNGQKGGQLYRGKGRSGDGAPHQNHRNGGDHQHYPHRNAGERQYHRPRDDGGRGRGNINLNPNPNPLQSFPASSSYASVADRSAAGAEPSSSSSSLVLQMEQQLKLEEETKSLEQQKQGAIPSSSKAIAFPNRPGFGKIGTPCWVRANHFFIKLSDNCDIHHYDVSISPEICSKGKNRAVIEQLVNLYKESRLGNKLPVYDGMKSLYTAGPLPFVSAEFQITLVDSSNRERNYTVTIRLVGRPDLHNMSIHALDVVLRESSSHKYNVKGRSFFSPDFGRPMLMGGGLECWRGFHQSLRPTQSGLSLNIDLKATSFFQPILVIDYVCQLLNRDNFRPLSDRERIKVKKALKGVKVQADYGVTCQYRITGITPVPTNQLMFPVDNGPEMSVVQYYKDKYNKTLKHANWPCLQAGNEKQPKYLPMEVFRIVGGQRYPKKLNDKQVTDMLRATCKCPAERENIILQIVGTNNYNNDEYANEFGIEVSNQFASVHARKLPTPMLKYQNTSVAPVMGVWNMMHKRVVDGATIDHWMCVNFSRLHLQQVDRFCRELIRMSNISGMKFRESPVFPHVAARDTNVDMELRRLHANAVAQLGKGLDMLIVVLPENGAIYGKLKTVCETELGIVSQCCLPKNVAKLSTMFVANVVLKINVKVGGRNAVLNDFVTKSVPDITIKPTIIFGADVTHPAPGEDSSPSIAAVVASQDWPEITKFRSLLSTQVNDIIQDLYKEEIDPKRGLVRGGMIQELLRSFADSTGQLPSRILFYRDGVSEGQFKQVLEEELLAIQKACASIRDDYCPTITFVVVQKRHNTRLVPFDHRDGNGQDKSGNILPGTVVDRGICHPSQFDFYLCSHSGIQGTSRPAHYHVLWDENQFTADSLQTLTYNVLYAVTTSNRKWFARCTRSVSIVPAAYYAHLAAFRGRFYLEETSESGSTIDGGGQGSSVVRCLPEVKGNLKNGMFYI